ncbi:MAG: universal stress protein [Magnetovibrionaceae bacterium]
MSHILTLTDGSAYAESTYDYAAWAAERMEASLEVLHALDHKREQADHADWSGSMAANEREELLQELADLDAKKSKVLQAKGRAILDAAGAYFAEKGFAETKLTLRNGGLVETVGQAEDTADLLVIGKRGETEAVAEAHLGANLERVVRGCHHPVLVATRDFRPIKRILLAFDGGPSSRKALQHAVNDKLLKGLDVMLLRVGPDKKSNREELAVAAEELEKSGSSVETLLMQGTPEDVIADVVTERDVDLLVVGAYGHSRIRHLIVGSTTSTLIRTIKVPLLMVR